MSSNVVPILAGPRWRVLVAHQRGMVRHALRTLIEAEDVAVVEVADGEAALEELAFGRLDLLILELDLPERDGVRVLQMHRALLAYQHSHVEPPDVIFAAPQETRSNPRAIEHLRSLGAAELIDDEPRSDVGAWVEMTPGWDRGGGCPPNRLVTVKTAG